MKNISHIRNCYGCGVCATVCAKKIIEITLNKDGFYDRIKVSVPGTHNVLNAAKMSNQIIGFLKPDYGLDLTASGGYISNQNYLSDTNMKQNALIIYKFFKQKGWTITQKLNLFN